MSMDTAFQRLNFFTGFFTTADDWNQGQEYHLEKRKLHNRGLHTAGVILGEKQNLAVVAAGDFNVRILPGAAVDAQGNLIYLPHAVVREIKVPSTLASDQAHTAYLYIAYAEQNSAYEENLEDYDYSGYKRKLEQPHVDYRFSLPDAASQIELARIDLQPGATQITDPVDPAHPQGNEINCCHVPTAGAKDPRLPILTAQLQWVYQQQHAMQQLHNRGLHTPGILQAVGDGLQVVAVGGLTVEVKPGAAVDGLGHEIYLSQPRRLTVPPAADLPQLFYIALKYADAFANRVVDSALPPDQPFASPCLAVTPTQPDNQTWLELARIDLQPGATALADPADPTNPQGNEINRCHRPKAGAIDPRWVAVNARLLALHEYHLARQRRLNKSLYNAGFLNKGEETFNVVAAGGLLVQVQPGAALDSAGNEVYLAQPLYLRLTPPPRQQWVYLVARYEDHFADCLADLDQPLPTTGSTAYVEETLADPTGKPWIELARVLLAPDATAIGEPDDATNPGPNTLDRRHRLPAATAVSPLPAGLDPVLWQQLAALMENTRKNFGQLACRFPHPSVDDVRYSALHLKMALGNLSEAQLPYQLQTLADVEWAVAQDLAKVYPPLVETDRLEYRTYQAAVQVLLTALRDGPWPAAVLNAQAQVAEAARDLADVVFIRPTADAGKNQTKITPTGEAIVTLDASASSTEPGQKIVSYLWEKEV